MPEGYVVIEGARYDGEFPSGKAIRVIVNSHFYNIPVSAIHDDSEIYAGTPTVVGKLIINEALAIQKGMIDDVEGSGIVLKKSPRSRLTPPQYTLTEKQLKRIEKRANDVPSMGFDGDDGVTFTGNGEAAALVGCREIGLFLQYGPEDMEALIREVKTLRAWAKKVCGV